MKHLDAFKAVNLHKKLQTLVTETGRIAIFGSPVANCFGMRNKANDVRAR